MRRVFHNEIPIIYLQITLVRTYWSLKDPLIIDGRGGSVESAKAANVSMIKLTQNSCVAVNGDSEKNKIPIKTTKMHEMLTVI
jgi:hypothetical protein